MRYQLVYRDTAVDLSNGSAEIGKKQREKEVDNI